MNGAASAEKVGYGASSYLRAIGSGAIVGVAVALINHSLLPSTAESQSSPEFDQQGVHSQSASQFLQEGDQSSGLFPREGGLSFDLDVIVVHDPGNPERHWGDDGIRSNIAKSREAILHSTQGRWRVDETRYFDVPVVLDSSGGVLHDDMDIHSCYSGEQIKKIVLDKLPGRDTDDIPLVIVDSDAACEENRVAGYAYTSGELPAPFAAVFPRVAASEGTIVHELGHLLGRDSVGPGLGHEARFGCLTEFQYASSDGAKSRLSVIEEAGTIQELVAAPHCGVPKNEDGTPYEYSSQVSIMGKSSNFVIGNLEWPVFSTPNIAALDPRRQVIENPGFGKYYLSYDLTQPFALSFDLPKDHALHGNVLSADKLLIGPKATYLFRDANGNKLYNQSYSAPEWCRTIGVFATSADSKTSTHIDTTGMYRYRCPASDDLRAASEYILYADEQLRMLVVGGVDGNDTEIIAEQKRREYVKIMPLDSVEAQELLKREKQRIQEVKDKAAMPQSGWEVVYN